MGKNLIG